MPPSPEPRAPVERRGVRLPFGYRRSLLVGCFFLAAEVAVILLPTWQLFARELPFGAAWLFAVPLVVAELAWIGMVASWNWPVRSFERAVGQGETAERELSEAAYRASWVLPGRLFGFRWLFWAGVALTWGVLLGRSAGWRLPQVVELGFFVSALAGVVCALRGIWSRAEMTRFRGRYYRDVAAERLFADGYAGHLTLASATCVAALGLAVIAFVYFYLPLSRDQFLDVQLLLGLILVATVVAQHVASLPLRSVVDDYFDSQLGSAGMSGREADTVATDIYRRGQALPYRLALVNILLWGAGAGGAAAWAHAQIRVALDDAIIMAGATLFLAVGSSLYQSLWHRESVRGLLVHLTRRYRVPVRHERPAFSVRGKLLLSFGGLVMFACGMALLWGFSQYKNLVTTFANRQAEEVVSALRARVEAATAEQSTRPDTRFVTSLLSSVEPRGDATVYYLPADAGGALAPVAGGENGGPRLPWYTLAQAQLGGSGVIEHRAYGLTGRYAALVSSWRGESLSLGSVAVLYPRHRGAGGVTGPLLQLLVFFLLLFGVCGGIVFVAASQFVAPIRKLESRADGMARGELAMPVEASGEADELGRLTFAVEEMRRALREKLRSTEEVNIDLERAVQRRTADLARKNRELAETLEKLTRAQDQLVRSEKMASIGQLVAGIAHEINNPVNAIVNTVGPLEHAIEEAQRDDPAARKEAADDLRAMLRVVERGAERTKGIVRALHNYSRTDDESIVDVDINRSLDDSLELLRHLLKQSITVERDYGDIGRVRGHAGQLGQVFMNLLTNAAQAVQGKSGARIDISTRALDGSVEIRIADNGVGISAEHIARIFDPFFTTKDVGEGSGLGLSIVHGIVERHGGSIEVDSELEKGTQFTVRLPYQAVEEPTPSAD